MGNGLSTLFWEDGLCEGGKFNDRFPRAYALEYNKRITVGSKLENPCLSYSFGRDPRGDMEETKVQEIVKLVQPVVFNQSLDKWIWSLNGSGEYTVTSSRYLIDMHFLPISETKTSWVHCVPIKANILAWKVMTNSLPTRFNISRRGIDIETLDCVNCDVGIETTNHLLFMCDMVKKVSQLIARWWDVPFTDCDSYGDWRTWIDNVKMPKKNKKMFEGIFFVMWWFLWDFRNKKMFEDKSNSKATFFDDVICKSYYWRRYRRKTLLCWDDWFKNPSLISL